MKTKQILSGALVVFFTAVFCINVFAIDGNGKIKKQDRSLTGFSSIEVGGAFHIILTQGEKEALLVETDENLLDYIVSKVNGSKLSVSSKKEIAKTKILNLYITVKDLKKIDISGAAEIKTTAKITCKDFEIDASGAADIKMTFHADKFKLIMSGSGEAELSGVVKDFQSDIAGAGALKAFSLSCETASINITGAGNAQITVQKELNVTVTGAGNIEYKGNPTLKKHISGAGSITNVK